METVKTIKFKLLPLTKIKRERLQSLVGQFKEVYDKTAVLLPSIKSLKSSMSIINQWRKDILKNIEIYAQTAQEAMKLAKENYLTAIQDNSKPEKLSKNIIRFHNQSWNLEEYNNRYYISIPIEKVGNHYNRIWLPIKNSEYYKDIILNNTKFGAGQIDIDTETFITSITLDVKDTDYEPETFIGIDLGLNNLAALVVLNKNKKVIRTKFWNGKETRHIRNKFKNYRKEVQSIGRKDLVKKTKGYESNWMKNINHNISREIVEITKQYPNPIIVMEELHKFTNFPWNFYQLRQMIEYKAKNKSIITKLINPKNTSNKCNKCGHIDKESRNGLDFKCIACGYQLHADLNAAINITKGF